MDYGRYLALLGQLGLNAQESLLYEVLLRAGPSRASDLAKRSKLTRTNTYNIANALAGKGLVSVDRAGKQLVFSPLHPSRLAALIDAQERRLADAKKRFDSQLKEMAADFMLGTSRPSVVTFDGVAGVIRAYDDLLNDRLPLQSIQDMLKLDRYLSEYNPRFIKERIRRRISHRLIAPESSKKFASTHAPVQREIRYLPDELFNWDIDLKVTAKKLVITTFMSETIVGIVVIHPDITRSILSLFETLWAGARLSPPEREGGALHAGARATRQGKRGRRS